MDVHDLWYLNRRGPDGKRLPSKQHGRGKRWRVRYKDSRGDVCNRLFEKKVDAENWDAQIRSGNFTDPPAQRQQRQVTLRDYGERWRLAREIGWAVETRKRVESNLRCHLYPAFGEGPMHVITLIDVL
jgi:hypothetical protein